MPILWVPMTRRDGRFTEQGQEKRRQNLNKTAQILMLKEAWRKKGFVKEILWTEDK